MRFSTALALCLALSIVLPLAGACHPSFLVTASHQGVTAHAEYDHGCPHETVPFVCVKVTTDAVTTTCDLLP